MYARSLATSGTLTLHYGGQKDLRVVVRRHRAMGLVSEHVHGRHALELDVQRLVAGAGEEGGDCMGSDDEHVALLKMKLVMSGARSVMVNGAGKAAIWF